MKKILVVDDEEYIQELVRINLEKSGYEVSVAYNGLEALEQLKKNNFDLMLLDLMMPEMDGFTLLQKIKEDENFKKIPVIILSAKSEEDDLMKGYDLGAESYLIKPFDPDTLMAMVTDLLK